MGQTHNIVSKKEIYEMIVCNQNLLDYIKKVSADSAQEIAVLGDLDFYIESINKINSVIEEAFEIKKIIETLQESIPFDLHSKYSHNSKLIREIEFCKDKCRDTIYILEGHKRNLQSIVNTLEGFDLIDRIEKDFNQKIASIEKYSVEQIKFIFMEDPIYKKDFFEGKIFTHEEQALFSRLDSIPYRRKEDIEESILRTKEKLNIIRELISTCQQNLEESDNISYLIRKTGEPTLENFLFDIQSFYDVCPSPQEVQDYIDNNVFQALAKQIDTIKEKFSEHTFPIETKLSEISEKDLATLENNEYYKNYKNIMNALNDTAENPQELISKTDYRGDIIFWTEYAENGLNKIPDQEEIERLKTINLTQSHQKNLKFASIVLTNIATIHRIKDRVDRKEWELFKKLIEDTELLLGELCIRKFIDTFEILNKKLEDIINFPTIIDNLWKAQGSLEVNFRHKCFDNATMILEEIDNTNSQYLYDVSQLRKIKHQNTKGNLEMREEDVVLINAIEYRLRSDRQTLKGIILEKLSSMPKSREEWENIAKDAYLNRNSNRYDLLNIKEKLQKIQEQLQSNKAKLENALIFYHKELNQTIEQ